MQNPNGNTLLEQVQAVSITDYDYPLPDSRIAQTPCEPRDAAMLLVDTPGRPTDSIFTELNAYLPAHAVVVVNDSRVIHARLAMQRPSGGRFEIFLLNPSSPASYEKMFAARGCVRWHCLMGRAQRWRSDTATSLGSNPAEALRAKRLEPHTGGEGIVEFSWTTGETFAELLDRLGRIPIPPYLAREATLEDDTWYQTVYARHEGSVAAPTAGLHLTTNLLNKLNAHGHPLLRTTLHVGAGTFLPVKGENIKTHSMHSERIVITRALIEGLLEAKAPIVAIGTTSMRTLESVYWIGCQLLNNPALDRLHLAQWYPYAEAHAAPPAAYALEAVRQHMDACQTNALEASTALIIAPGYTFRIVDALVTNFHQPRSTLLLLVAALIGDRWRALYGHALNGEYRFLSYGDGMLLFNRNSKNL